MNFAGLADQYTASDTSDDDGSDASSRTDHAKQTEEETALKLAKRPRTPTLDESHPSQNPSVLSSISQVGRIFSSSMPPSTFLPDCPPPSKKAKGNMDAHSRPPPPPFDEAQPKPSADTSFANGSGKHSKSSSHLRKLPSSISVYFLPPQVGRKRPNISTEDMTLYGFKKGQS